MPCRQGGTWVNSRSNSSGATRRTFADAPRSHHAPLLRVDACLAHAYVLQNILQQTGLEVTALVTMKLPRCSEAAELRNHCRNLLVRKGVGFRPLGKIVHSDQEVSISFVAPWEGPCHIVRGSVVVLVHLAPTSGSGAATSQHRVLPAASTTFAGPYSEPC